MSGNSNYGIPYSSFEGVKQEDYLREEEKQIPKKNN